MATIDYNNAHLTDVLGCNGDVLREFNETDLEISSEYVELWDVGRKTIVGAWVDSTGKIAEIVDETTREAESELALDDGFSCVF